MVFDESLEVFRLPGKVRHLYPALAYVVVIRSLAILPLRPNTGITLDLRPFPFRMSSGPIST